MQELAREAAGRPILVCDNSTIAADGTVYVTGSSGVRQAGGELWLGSLVERAVARVSL